MDLEDWFEDVLEEDENLGIKPVPSGKKKTIMKITRTIFLGFLSAVYLPKPKLQLIGSIALDKGYYYVMHRHLWSPRQIREFTDKTYETPEIIDVTIQFIRFLQLSELEDTYLDKYRTTEPPPSVFK